MTFLSCLFGSSTIIAKAKRCVGVCNKFHVEILPFSFFTTTEQNSFNF